jgi:flavin reductase (DIM6/NTAB) family NADH-FMN oxidoreductase RutF
MAQKTKRGFFLKGGIGVMKVKLPDEEFYHLINHGPCVLITSGSKGIKNVAPIAWVTAVNDEPPLVAACISSAHYTAELIDKYKEFVINIPSVELLEVVEVTGKVSGRKVDKFKLAKIITPEDGVKVNVVHIKECIGFIEAEVCDCKEYGGVKLYIGKVLHCEVEDSVYDKYLIIEKAKTFHHLGGNKFCISGKEVKI